MANSEPVYSFRDASTPAPPDLTGINEVLGRYMRLELRETESSPDTDLLALRHHLLERLLTHPECVSDVEKLLGEVNDLVAECIYASDDRDTIARECLKYWRDNLLPHYTELCVDTVRLKLQAFLSMDTQVDLRFALERGIRNQVSWEDLLLQEVGPAITRSNLSPEVMRHALGIIHTEYEGALRVARL